MRRACVDEDVERDLADGGDPRQVWCGVLWCSARNFCRSSGICAVKVSVRNGNGGPMIETSGKGRAEVLQGSPTKMKNPEETMLERSEVMGKRAVDGQDHAPPRSVHTLGA